MYIDEMLSGELTKEFEELNKMEVGTDKYRTAVDGITKLTDRLIEVEKMNVENQNKQKMMEDERKDRMIKNGLTAAGIVIPTAVTIWGTFKSFKFEETGTITTMMGRGFINKLLPKK